MLPKKPKHITKYDESRITNNYSNETNNMTNKSYRLYIISTKIASTIYSTCLHVVYSFIRFTSNNDIGGKINFLSMTQKI